MIIAKPRTPTCVVWFKMPEASCRRGDHVVFLYHVLYSCQTSFYCCVAFDRESNKTTESGRTYYFELVFSCCLFQAFRALAYICVSPGYDNTAMKNFSENSILECTRWITLEKDLLSVNHVKRLSRERITWNITEEFTLERLLLLVICVLKSSNSWAH